MLRLVFLAKSGGHLKVNLSNGYLPMIMQLCLKPTVPHSRKLGNHHFHAINQSLEGNIK